MLFGFESNAFRDKAVEELFLHMKLKEKQPHNWQLVFRTAINTHAFRDIALDISLEVFQKAGAINKSICDYLQYP